MKCDVLVAGAGPAGSSAAYHLAGLGLRVLLVDRHAFPREKACGDALGPPCIELLETMGVRRCLVAQRPVTGMRIGDLVGGGSTRSLYWSRSSRATYGLVVPRFALDHELVERAQEAGAVFWPSTSVTALRFEKGRVRGVRASHAGQSMDIEAGITVVAEGSKGRLGQAIRGPDHGGTSIGYAVRQYATGVSMDQDTVEVYAPVKLRGVPIAGYAWVFPACDYVNIGVGFSLSELRRSRVNLRDLWDAALTQMRNRFPHLANLRPSSPLMGAPLRLTLEPERCVVDGALVVGDAAGVIDPFTAEGIRNALETGALAAPVVAAALGGAGNLSKYAVGLRARYSRQVHLAPALPHLFSLGERFGRSVGGGYAQSLIDRKTRRGPIVGAIRGMVFDVEPRDPGLSHAHWLARRVPAAAAFCDRVSEEVLASLREINPIVSESMRYLQGSPTALLRMPSVMAWGLAHCWGFADADSVLKLARAGELLVLARLLLGDVGGGGGSRFGAYYDAASLLWGDVSLARSLMSLFALPQACAIPMLDGAMQTFESALGDGRRRETRTEGRRRTAMLDCTSICTAGASGMARLAAVDRERAAWATQWARSYALAERSVSRLVADCVGDGVLGLERRPMQHLRLPTRRLSGHLAVVDRTLNAARTVERIEPLEALLCATRGRLAAALRQIERLDAPVARPTIGEAHAPLAATQSPKSKEGSGC